MPKIGVITLTAILTLLTGVAGYAADKIALVCSGTMETSGPPGSVKSPYGNLTVVIDLDRGIVTIPLGDFPITEVTKTYIKFKAADGRVDGRIDRISGAMGETMGLGNVRLFFDLTCKSAKPLF